MSIPETSDQAERRRGRPRSAEKDDAILEAAARLFMERGFEAVSMDAIAEAAGVAKVTIYARYPDKDALFRAVLQHKCESIVAPSLFEHGGNRSVRESLTLFAHSFLNLVLSPDAVNMHRIITAEGARAPRVAELFMESAVDRMCQQLSRFFAKETAARRLSVSAGDEPRLAWRFMGAVKGHPHMRAMMGLPHLPAHELDDHVAACVDDLLRAWGPANAKGRSAS